MSYTLDDSVTAMVAEDPTEYVIHQGKVIDLSKLDIDSVRNRLCKSPYKAVEIENIRTLIEESLEQLINRNCTRHPFSQRYKNIIDNYNAG